MRKGNKEFHKEDQESLKDETTGKVKESSWKAQRIPQRRPKTIVRKAKKNKSKRGGEGETILGKVRHS